MSLEVYLMTEKQQNAYNTIITNVPEKCREFYSEAADYAISLGYLPVINKGQTYIDFIKNKIKKYILKITAIPNTSHWIAVQFYALPEYNGIFKMALDERISKLRSLGHEPNCWGCGRCDKTLGYKFVRPDGTQGFLCGAGVLQFPLFNVEHVSLIKDALKKQDDFLMKHFGETNLSKKTTTTINNS
jgi:hypothetical protein